MNKQLLIRILRWIARIWSILSISFLSFMFIAHLFGEESGSFNSINEVFLFLFYVVGVFLGMILSWKWEGIGGIMGTVSIIVFHLIEPKFYLDPWIDGLAFPVILFLICWYFSQESRIKPDYNSR